ncbi:hypothetical protein UFOVP188_46 [uncultured Caudovirales phage]|uniref:DUF7936 domain-containing protein n=1 Tax=uncultured Caudovirales phage TaxID=2100421 RepID=A0A6J7WGB8_9CAUD|nr:hypothetical protein UFOVP188_46 [uncultured Caudovirales phage]
MSITWTVEQLNRQASDGFVTTAHWRATAVDGEHSATVYGTCGWTAETPNIPYDQLTQETVLGWIWTNGVDKEVIEANLASQIELQKHPVTKTGVPW